MAYKYKDSQYIFLHFLHLFLLASAQASLDVHSVFSQDLKSIWEDAKFQPELQEGLSICQHTADQNDDGKDHISPCNKIYFLNAVVARQANFDRLQEKTSDISFDKLPIETTIEKRNLVDFQEFFVGNAIGNKAAVITGIESQIDGTSEKIKNCAEGGQNGWNNLLQCKRSLDDVMVQKYVANDYFQRLPSKKYGARTPLGFSSFGNAESVVHLHVCPFAQHMAIEVLTGAIEGKMFAPEHMPFLDPKFMTEGDDGFTAEPVFTADAFASNLPSSVFKVLKEEFAFIPSGHPVAWKTTEVETVLMKYCYVDASNFNSVKNELQLAGQVNLEARNMWQELSSPTLDLQMTRLPEAMPYPKFHKWPREDVGEATSSGTPQGKNRRDKKNFKDWQDDKKWKWRVTQLTLPTLKPPKVTAYRSNATVSFSSSYRKSDTDASIVAYNISWTAVGSDQENGKSEVSFTEFPDQQLERKPTHAFGYGVPGYDYTARVEGLNPNTIYTFQIAVVHNDVCGPFSGSSKAARTLPILPPGCAVNITGEALGPSSMRVCWHSPLDDGGEQIEGYHLMKFHSDEHTFEEWVFLGTYTPQVFEDGRLCVDVIHLLPASGYSFQMAAINSAGVGEWSPESDTFYTNASSGEVHEIFGRGFHDVVHSAQRRSHFVTPENLEAYHPHMTENFDVHGPVITLHDHSSTIQVHTDGPSFEIETWTCHWSSNSFSVTAEAVFADPRDASTSLKNSVVTHKRIVMVERGGVPMVKKVLYAQAAGALGVIIVDSGKCKRFDQNCVIGADRSRNELFAQYDLPVPWQKVRIPVVLILQDDLLKIEQTSPEPKSVRNEL